MISRHSELRSEAAKNPGTIVGDQRGAPVHHFLSTDDACSEVLADQLVTETDAEDREIAVICEHGESASR